MSLVRFLVGDVFDRMAELPDASVDLIVTSPPFLALRSYLPDGHPNKAKEIGSEPTPAAYLTTLLALTREWRRILAPHGSICVELGDTSSGSGNGPDALKEGRNGSHDLWLDESVPKRRGPGWPLPKSLCGIPTLYAWSLAYGRNLLNPADRIEPWRIRNLIVWHRPNPPVGALGDKVRPATSYITVACCDTQKRPRWFDLDAERGPYAESTVKANPGRMAGANISMGNKATNGRGMEHAAHTHEGAPPLDCWIDGDVWTIPTAPYKGSHYATYPPALPRRLIRLMCPMHVCTTCGEPRRRITETINAINHLSRRNRSMADRADAPLSSTDFPDRADVRTLGWSDCGCRIHPNDILNDAGKWRRGHVLDPFAGSGTTGQAAIDTGRNATLIDIDERNLDLARQRVGLFLEDSA